MSIGSWFAKLVSSGAAGDSDGQQATRLLREATECQDRGDYGDAEDGYRQVLVLQSENVDARQRLAQVLALRALACQERGEFDAAAAGYEESLALDGTRAQVRNNLGNVYRSQGRIADAIAAYRDALATDGSSAEGHVNLAILLWQTGERRQAVSHCRTGLELRPSFPEANATLGFFLAQEGDATGAVECYRKAISAQPGYAEAHVNYALQLLLLGEYRLGWAEYEWRKQLPGLEGVYVQAGLERWDGSPLGGKVIFLYAEQGFGDVIQFVRYAPLVAERGGNVVVMCPPKLRALVESVEGVSTVLQTGDPLPAFDACAALMSLPRIFETTVGTIPARVPYVRADAEKSKAWKARFAADEARFKVGLYWATDTKSTISPLRSLTLDMLSPLAMQGITYYSLQRGSAAGQAGRPPAGMALIDLSTELADFSDDAAVMANLDLVISIDTATAHLAGAMGVQVWTLTHFPTDWRWLLGREDSAWYPTMRLFRQGAADDWGQVLGRMAEALRALVGRRAT